MGNCLEATPTSPFDASLLLQLKEKPLVDVIECMKVLMEDYPDCPCIDYNQFEDVFAPLVDDAEPFFLLLQNEHSLDGVVDIYEAIAVFAVFSKDKFDTKVNFIFELFDFDKSRSLEQPELALTLQAVLRGLCKFVHIPPPHHKSFEEESIEIFKIIDRDDNKRISISEFLFWTKHNPELQNFLLKYAGIQTYENLKMRYNDIFTEYLFFFTSALDAKIDGFADARVIRKAIEKKEQGLVKKEDIDFLFEILKNTTEAFLRGKGPADDNLIYKEAYEAVMKAWCSFAASDLNRDNLLVIPELHALLWVYEDREPTEERVAFEMKEMGKSGIEGLVLNDWIRNLCVQDSLGRYAIRPSLKKLFDKYDVDGSGFLSFEELKQIIGETFRGYIARAANFSVQNDVNNIVSSLTKEIFGELDQDGSRGVAWEEFKKFMEISWKKIDKLRSFLDKNMEFHLE